MRKLLSVLLILAFPVVTLSQAPDFTMTSTSGETYNLQDQLDSGKTIVLDFFSTTCGTCQTGVPTVEKIWNDVLLNGEKGWVWAVEIGYHNETQIDEFFNEYGGTFPAFSVVEDDSIINPDFGFDVPYAPQYFVVCPDGKYKNVALNMVESEVEKCAQQTGIKNNTYQIAIHTLRNSFMLENLPYSYGDIQVRVINTMGKTVSSDIINGRAHNWQSPELEKGIYIIQVSGQGNLHFAQKVAL
ncbi:MAG TPA: TlpA disulfide reductase family protein [Salinivirga sp.]|uniref:TlpA disulfide reductase family protein n=1 Tax=Salinivirga sp. TaxID=1970192 RepID=UPI002B47E806|nr:TlpA disulfide reductase family protein [Salinivirga sp.]HKK59767.1 TlpA disulfide reductase family protein [Salinivirga sp.]